MEMEILIDKHEHPEKYITLIKKKSDAERFEMIKEKGKRIRGESLDLIRESVTHGTLGS